MTVIEQGARVAGVGRVAAQLAAEAGVDPRAAATFLVKVTSQRQTAEGMYKALYEAADTGPWRFETNEHAVLGVLDHGDESIEITLASATRPVDWALAEALLRLQARRAAA